MLKASEEFSRSQIGCVASMDIRVGYTSEFQLIHNYLALCNSSRTGCFGTRRGSSTPEDRISMPPSLHNLETKAVTLQSDGKYILIVSRCYDEYLVLWVWSAVASTYLVLYISGRNL
jgi:hypothetical protein